MISDARMVFDEMRHRGFIKLEVEVDPVGACIRDVLSLLGGILEMPSLKTALPPELANNVIRLYRECLWRAKYVGHKQNNIELVVDMVRQQFKRHMHETDPEKIQKLKDDVARGLINHILYESEQLSGRKMSKSA